MAFDSPGTMLSMVQSGRVKALAMGGKTRDPQLPNVPTIGELFPGNDVTFWFGVVGPAGMPKDRVDWLNRELRKSLDDTKVKARLYAAGYPITPGTPEEFARFIRTSHDDYARIVKEYNIQQ